MSSSLRSTTRRRPRSTVGLREYDLSCGSRARLSARPGRRVSPSRGRAAAGASQARTSNCQGIRSMVSTSATSFRIGLAHASAAGTLRPCAIVLASKYTACRMTRRSPCSVSAKPSACSVRRTMAERPRPATHLGSAPRNAGEMAQHGRHTQATVRREGELRETLYRLTNVCAASFLQHRSSPAHAGLGVPQG